MSSNPWTLSPSSAPRLFVITFCGNARFPATENFDGELHKTAGAKPAVIYTEVDTEKTVQQVQGHIEACQYNQALERIWRQILDPANQFADKKEPWKLVKT